MPVLNTQISKISSPRHLVTLHGSHCHHICMNYYKSLWTKASAKCPKCKCKIQSSQKPCKRANKHMNQLTISKCHICIQGVQFVSQCQLVLWVAFITYPCVRACLRCAPVLKQIALSTPDSLSPSKSNEDFHKRCMLNFRVKTLFRFTKWT